MTNAKKMILQERASPKLGLPSAGIGPTSFFVMLFIAAPAVLSVIPSTFNIAFLYTTGALIAIFCILHIRDLIQASRVERAPVVLAAVFAICGVVTNVVSHHISIFNVYMPLASLCAYLYVSRRRLVLWVLDVYFGVLYAIFIATYYLVIPALIYRPDFDEDLDVYDNCSSNTIPIHLNLTLLIYLVLNRLYDGKRQLNIVILAIINCALIIIQQSRMGLACSFVLLVVAVSDRLRGTRRAVGAIACVACLAVLIFKTNTAQGYINIMRGQFSGADTLKNDIRGAAQARFFEILDVRRALLGYEEQVYASSGEYAVGYTYNTVLDLVCRYGVAPLIILVACLFTRVANRENYVVPLGYFAPLFMYWLVESVNFPNFWDFFVLLMWFRRYPMSLVPARASLAGIPHPAIHRRVTS